jgi:hypothetical protein
VVTVNQTERHERAEKLLQRITSLMVTQEMVQELLQEMLAEPCTKEQWQWLEFVMRQMQDEAQEVMGEAAALHQ